MEVSFALFLLEYKNLRTRNPPQFHSGDFHWQRLPVSPAIDSTPHRELTTRLRLSSAPYYLERSEFLVPPSVQVSSFLHL